MSLSQRVIEIRNYYKLSQLDFAEGLGVTRQTVSNIEREKNAASWEFMVKVLNKFPQINVKWFVLGEGEMLEDLAVVNDKQAPYGKDHKDALIEVLQRERELLNRELKRLRKMIPGEEDS